MEQAASNILNKIVRKDSALRWQYQEKYCEEGRCFMVSLLKEILGEGGAGR